MKYVYTIRPSSIDDMYHLRVYLYDESRNDYLGDFVMSYFDSLNKIMEEVKSYEEKK